MTDSDGTGPPEGDPTGAEDGTSGMGQDDAEQADQSSGDGVVRADTAGGSPETSESESTDTADDSGTPDSSSGDDDSAGIDGTTGSTPVDPDEIDPEALTVPLRSLHPRVRILWILRAVISAAVVGGGVAALDRFVLDVGPMLPVGVAGLLLVAGIAHALLHYRIWQYEVREDALYLERGVVTRVRTVVPFVRIQHVDTSRGPVERLVGLSTSVVYTAGSRGADVSIPGLEAERAEDLQGRLKRLAIAADGDDAV